MTFDIGLFLSSLTLLTIGFVSGAAWMWRISMKAIDEWGEKVEEVRYR